MKCDECGMVGFHLGDCPQRVGNDAINPKHYEHVSGVTTIEVNRAMTYDIGNAFKYVLRHKEKGNPHQDLTKARWYIADAVKNDEGRIFGAGYNLDRTEITILLTRMWEAEPDAAIRCFFRALLKTDLAMAGDIVDVMIERCWNGEQS